MKNRLPKSMYASGPNGRRSATVLALPAPRVSFGRRVMGRAAQSVGDYPIATLTAAFVTGLVLAAWVKRT
jgi:hypothetical protein